MTWLAPGITLLRLRAATVDNQLRAMTRGTWLKLMALGLLTAAFMTGEGVLAELLLRAIYSKEDLAPDLIASLIHRLLSLVFLLSLSMLFFSNVTASIANIYLSRDIDLLLATPISASWVFALKFVETLLNSSYMIVLFVTPILVALGIASGASLGFYAQIPLTLALLVLPPAAAGILLTMVLMRYLPARRTHQMLSAVGVVLAISLITMLRVLAPERLLAPTATEDFRAVIGALTVPASEYLPSTWAADTQLAALSDDWAMLPRSLGPLLVTALACLIVTHLAARHLYFRGVTASHESARRRRAVVGVAPVALGQGGRDFKTFFRDPTQWTQLLLLGALIVIYVFNITALPTELMLIGAFLTIRDVVAWVNVGLAGFVLAAIGMRFVLPSLSTEGGAFWMFASSPSDRRTYLLRKLLFFVPPMVVFSLGLVALSGQALGVDEHTQRLSLATTVLVTATLTTMAVGLGAALPSFKLENPTQYVLTPGGILYGVMALVYVMAVVALQARPFFSYILAQAGVLAAPVDGRPYYAAIVVLSVLLAGWPLWWGLRRLEALEM